MRHYGVLQHHAAGAQLQRFQYLPLVYMSGEDNGAGGAAVGGQLAQSFHTRHPGHGQIEQQDIGPQGAHHVQRFDPVFGFGDYFNLAVGLEHVAQANAHHGMIVSY